MAGWMLNKKTMNSGALEGNEIVSGFVGSQKSGVELMQNCDLPPPLKVFAGSDKTVITSMNRICSMMGQEGNDDGGDDGLHVSRSSDESDSKDFLKALQLSQTRAREAERKSTMLAKERDCLSKALLEQSLRLYAYRQWVKLLELQVLKLQKQRQEQEFSLAEEDNNNDDYVNVGAEQWVVALALCLGIVGVGLAFGCRYLF